MRTDTLRSRRALLAFLFVAFTASAACSGGSSAGPDAGGASRPPTSSDPTAATAAAEPDATASGAGAPVVVVGDVRWGDGRALAARAAADRTVVATTVGVSLQTAGGSPIELASGLPSLLALSPDGRFAAFTMGEVLEVWDLEGPSLVARHPVAADQYASLDFSSPTDLIAAGGLDVARFPTDGGPPEALATAAPDRPFGPAAVGADGAVAVPVATARPGLVVWRAGSPARTVDLGLGDGDQVVGVVWSGDAEHLAVLLQPLGEGESVAVWDVAAGTYRGRVAIPNFVTAPQVAFPQPDRVVVPVGDRLTAFDLDGAAVTSAPIPSGDVSAVQATDPAVVVTGWDGRLRRWVPGDDPVDLAPTTAAIVDRSTVEGTADVVVVDHYGAVRRIGPGGEEERIDRYAAGEVTTVDVGPSAAAVALGASTGAVRVLRVADGAVERELDRPEGNVAAVAFAPGGTMLATGLGVQLRTEVWNDAVAVTDLSDERTVTTFGGEQENVAGCSFFQGALDFSPDGSLLAASSHDYTVELARVDGSGGDPTVLEPHLGTVLDVEFSPDGSLLATSSEDGTLRMWDVATKTLAAEHTAPPGGYWALAFTPDGSALAVADVEGRISLLDVASGEVLRTLDGAKAQSGDMVFTADGSRLVAAGADGDVDVWSVERGSVVERLVGHTMPVTAVAVADDGTAVVSGSLDGTVRWWPLDA